MLLAWLACICTSSLASADVVAGTSFAAAEAEAKAAEVPLPPPPLSPPSKCLDTCITAGDAVCQSGFWGPSGVWRELELGTDCTCTTSCDNHNSPHFGVEFLFELRGRAWTQAEGCKCTMWAHDAAVCEQYRKDASVMNPAEECGITMTPATQYTVSFPVAGTIDLAASIRKDNSSLWLDVRAGVQSYLQCFNTDWGSADCWVQIILNRGGMSIEAVVTDYSGNGSSTATLERAAALSQGSKAGALFASLPEALFKALGPVTVSAPSLVMLPADVHYTDGQPPQNNDYKPFKGGYYGEEFEEGNQFRFQFIRAKPYGEDYTTDNKPLHDVVLQRLERAGGAALPTDYEGQYIDMKQRLDEGQVIEFQI